MATLKVEDKEIVTDTDETVLDALLRNGIAIPYGCRQGGCYSCLIYCVDVVSPEEAQDGLADEEIEQNGFFACLCKPEQDMTIILNSTS